MLMPKSLLLRFGLHRFVRDFERCRPDDLRNRAAPDALRAHEQRFMAPIGRRDIHSLQVRLERAPTDAGDLGADATQILLLTARRDPVAYLRTFATHSTLPSHRLPRLD